MKSLRVIVTLTGIRVADVRHAFEVSTANGAEGVLPPTELTDEATGTSAVVSEIRAYGDCVLRFISGSFQVGQPHWVAAKHADACACRAMQKLALSLGSLF